MWFGVGLRVQGSTGSGSLREGGLGSMSGRIGFVLVGVDLVVAKILSGPRHRVGLGIRGEELGILEEVLGVSVSTTWASGFSGIRSGKKYLSHLRSSGSGGRARRPGILWVRD